MAVFIIDFDRTIVNGHTHNTIARFHKTLIGPNPAWEIDEQHAQWELVKNIPPITALDLDWKTVLKALLHQGHQVAIASFSSYPHIITRYLQEVIGLSEADIGKIYIEAWLPEQPSIANKNKHIHRILQHFKFKGAREDIVIVDDSKINTDAAIAEHFTVIPAHDAVGNPLTNGKHLVLLMKKINNE